MRDVRPVLSLENVETTAGLNWPNFIIVVSGNREVQAEGERWETVARVVRIHTTFIQFAILYWCNSYKCTNNEKI